MTNSVKDIANSIEKDVQDEMNTVNKAVEQLANFANSKLHELADNELKSTKDVYKNAISLNKISDNAYELILDLKQVGFIEEGLSARNMIQDLLGKSPKTVKHGPHKGQKYRIIPMKQGEPTKQAGTTPNSTEILNNLNSAIKKHNVNMNMTSLDSNLKPVSGRIKRISANSPRPMRKDGSTHAKTNALSGVEIFQGKNKNTGKFERSAVVYRIAAEWQQGTGLWDHPGIQAKKLMDKVFDRVSKEADDIFVKLGYK